MSLSRTRAIDAGGPNSIAAEGADQRRTRCRGSALEEGKRRENGTIDRIIFNLECDLCRTTVAENECLSQGIRMAAGHRVVREDHIERRVVRGVSVEMVTTVGAEGGTIHRNVNHGRIPRFKQDAVISEEVRIVVEGTIGDYQAI